MLGRKNGVPCDRLRPEHRCAGRAERRRDRVSRRCRRLGGAAAVRPPVRYEPVAIQAVLDRPSACGVAALVIDQPGLLAPLAVAIGGT